MRKCANCQTRKPDYMFTGKLPVCQDCSVHGPMRDEPLTSDTYKPKLDFRPDGFGARLGETARKLDLPGDVLGSRGYSMDPNGTHSRGIRPHPHGREIAKELLRKHNWNKAAAMGEFVERITAEPDDRPLIDKLQEATFHEPVGLQWIEDKYGLRMLLRKAHCFTLDTVTSSLVADFSIAIASDMESARRMAIPPFPVTWIDMDNHARLKRMAELGVQLTDQAAGTSGGGAVPRVGWLIHPDSVNGGYYATYVCEVEEGVTLSPLSYWWHSDASNTLNPRLAGLMDDIDISFMDRLSFGMRDSGVSPSDAIPSPTPMHIKLMHENKYPPQVRDLMIEIGGELRHIWGFLIALGAGQLGIETKYNDQAKPTTVRTMKNGKPLLPLEHKVLHLHLAKKMTVEKVILRSITHHRHRWHEVRAHFRTLRNADGTVRKRVPVKSHERGDKLLGRVEKQYSVER